MKPRVLSTRLSSEVDEFLVDLAEAYAVPSLRVLTRQMRHERRDGGVIAVTDRFEFSAPQPFETALTTLGSWTRQADGSILFRQGDEWLVCTIEASTPWVIAPEVSDEEGLKFTRIGVRLLAPSTQGFVTLRFTRPLRMAPTGS